MERYGSIESVLRAEIVELGAALDAEREKVKELKEWQRVVVGTGTDQEAVVRMAATEYTKTAVQCWKDENAKLTAQLATLQAQLRQVEGERDHAKKMEAVQKEVADNQTWHVRQLRQLVEVHTKQLTELTIIPIGCSREQELRWTQSIKDLRAVLAAQDAGKAVSSG